MPEGNEIHRWAERHGAAFAGQKVRVEGPNGRFTDAAVLDGRVLQGVRAVGKHLGYDFGKDRILHVHLGLQGDFTEGSGPLPEMRGALRLRISHPGRVKLPPMPGESKRHSWYSEDDGTGHLEPGQISFIELLGPTDCSVYTEEQWQKLTARLGPDPLNGDAPEKALERIGKSRKPIAALLMEQDVIAGIGNIYRAELLFRARLNPFTPGKDVPGSVVKAIYQDAVPLMKAGMVDRRIVTTLAKDRPHKRGKALKEEAHYVYRRNGHPCFVCGTAVKKMEGFFGRNLFWCGVCQAGPGEVEAE